MDLQTKWIKTYNIKNLDGYYSMNVSFFVGGYYQVKLLCNKRNWLQEIQNLDNHMLFHNREEQKAIDECKDWIKENISNEGYSIVLDSLFRNPAIPSV